MAFIWVFLGVVHAGEGLYATLLAKKHQMPFSTAVRPQIHVIVLAKSDVVFRYHILRRSPSSGIRSYSTYARGFRQLALSLS